METIAELEAAIAALDEKIQPLTDERTRLYGDLRALKELLAEETSDLAVLISEYEHNAVASRRLEGMMRELHPSFHGLGMWYPTDPWGNDPYSGQHQMVLHPHIFLTKSMTGYEPMSDSECMEVAEALVRFREVIPQDIPENDNFPAGMRVSIHDVDCSMHGSYYLYYNEDGSEATLYHSYYSHEEPRKSGTLAEVLTYATKVVNTSLDDD